MLLGFLGVIFFLLLHEVKTLPMCIREDVRVS